MQNSYIKQTPQKKFSVTTNKVTYKVNSKLM